MSESHILVRKAILPDVPDIHRLIEKATKNGKILKRSRKEIKKNIGAFYVAEENQIVIGCCSLEIYSRKLAEVRSLAVSHERQRRGVASLLIKHCVHDANRQGVSEVLAITDRINLFKRHGFSEQLHGQKALFIRTHT